MVCIARFGLPSELSVLRALRFNRVAPLDAIVVRKVKANDYLGSTNRVQDVLLYWPCHELEWVVPRTAVGTLSLVEAYT
jgi:hypothetical protein